MILSLDKYSSQQAAIDYELIVEWLEWRLQIKKHLPLEHYQPLTLRRNEAKSITGKVFNNPFIIAKSDK